VAAADPSGLRADNDRRGGWARRALMLAGPALLAIGSLGWYLAGGGTSKPTMLTCARTSWW